MKRFLLLFLCSTLCLATFAANEAPDPDVLSENLFPDELFQHVYPGSENKDKTCPQCPPPKEEAALRCGACKDVHYCSAKHQKAHRKEHKEKCRKYVAMRAGEKNAYDYIARLIKNRENVLTTEHILAVNKIFLTAFDSDEIDPENYGTFRNTISAVKKKGQLLNFPFKCSKHGRTSLVPRISVHRTLSSKEDKEAWQHEHGSHVFSLVGDSIEADFQYLNSLRPEEKAAERRWYKDNLHFYPPLAISSFFPEEPNQEKEEAAPPEAVHPEESDDDEQKVTPSADESDDDQQEVAPSADSIEGELKDLLDYSLKRLRNNISKIEPGDEDAIIHAAALAHSVIYYTHPFHNAHKRTSRAIMNGILVAHGLPAVWFEDYGKYIEAVLDCLEPADEQKGLLLKLLHETVQARMHELGRAK